MKPTLVQLPVIDVREIAKNLHRLADRIEAGKLTPNAAIVVLGYEGGASPGLYCYGENLDTVRVLGLLQLATDVGIRNCMTRHDRTAEG